MLIDVGSLTKNSASSLLKKFREDALNSLNIALEEVDPYKSVLRYVLVNENFAKFGDRVLNLNEFEHIYLIAFGKASIKMSQAILSLVKVDNGIVVSNEEPREIPKNLVFIKGGHPIPNENSVKGGKLILDLINNTRDDDLTIILISGGGSALVEVPLVEFEGMQGLTKELLKRGTNINELNAVRKHLSEIKGGRLLKHGKGVFISLIISDVVGDPLDTIASGPTYFDTTTYEDAFNVLQKYGLLDKYPSIVEVIKRGIRGEIEETLKEKESISCSFENILVASNYQACEVTKKFLFKKGYSVLYLGSSIQGEASQVAKVIYGIGLSGYKGQLNFKKPIAIVFGGETTVLVKGKGIGGRNTELILSTIFGLKDILGVFVSLGTDGIDGVSKGAGAIADSETFKRALDKGLDVNQFLENNDSFTFFDELEDAIITGPTGTNVADIGIFIVG